MNLNSFNNNNNNVNNYKLNNKAEKRIKIKLPFSYLRTNETFFIVALKILHLIFRVNKQYTFIKEEYLQMYACFLLASSVYYFQRLFCA